jgi:hypothetical protein
MITEQDLKSLEIVFTYARQTVVHNEQELSALINLKADLFKRLNELLPKEERFSETVVKKLNKRK